MLHQRARICPVASVRAPPVTRASATPLRLLTTEPSPTARERGATAEANQSPLHTRRRRLAFPSARPRAPNPKAPRVFAARASLPLKCAVRSRAVRVYSMPRPKARSKNGKTNKGQAAHFQAAAAAHQADDEAE